jgi:hypothetical protein
MKNSDDAGSGGLTIKIVLTVLCAVAGVILFFYLFR